ncbi:glycosyltransferase [Prosthecobacter fluviatilis]|uniref:Glycosyltransferase n=1 Tax=Prosthecobacter fluviatilis TaxID=445931 RepID=A0ABW0KKK7_9BACT
MTIPTSRVRLLQIVDSLCPGGMENIMVRVCNHLQARGASVTVCCLSASGPFASRLHPDVEVSVLQKPPGFSLNTIAKLRKLIRRGDFDVVHTHHLGGLIYSSLARLPHKHPRIVHSEHILWGKEDLSQKRQRQRKLLYRACHCVFTVAGQQMDQMKRMGHRHAWQTVLTNGVDSGHFRPATENKAALRQKLGLAPEGLWLVKVARFGDTKRHADLLQAFEQAHASAPQLRLLLVGDGGAEKDHVLSQMEKSRARDAIHWAGFQQDPLPYYQAADALVVASSFEGLPNAVLEGMACGLPVLANQACGAKEVAHDEEHGWIRDYSTVDRLREALLGIAGTDMQKLLSIGKAGREHVCKHYSMTSMLAKYESLYSAVASGHTVNLESVTAGAAASLC